MRSESTKRISPGLFIIFLVCLFVQTNLSARNSPVISISEAQTVALNFFKLNAGNVNAHAQLSASLKYTKTADNDAVAFYVFDIDPAPGFVIVSGNRNITPVLGYSTERHFNSDFNGKGVNTWMRNTVVNINLACQNHVLADTPIADRWAAYHEGTQPSINKNAPVAALMTTLWDQENPGNPPPYLYNLYCPYSSSDHQRCLTGCVATAMAQIMKFWNYPVQGTDSFTYANTVGNGFSYNYGTQSANFGAATYDWANMTNAVTNSSTGATDSAIDLLMYHCAVSVGMDFGDDNQDGSGAEAVQNDVGAGQPCSQYAFANYFKYNPGTLQGVYRTDYSATAWIALIEAELTAGHPVLYEGNDATQGGHAWVCDGFDANDMFHMNWGWSGQDDGYFAVTNLTTTGNYNPILDEEALIGIEPLAVTTGLKSDSPEVSFNVYPNPANGNIILHIAQPEAGTIITLKNMLGQDVLSKNISEINSQIDVSDISAGIYLVELTKDGNSVSKKIVIT
ncbi:MAG: Peptidase family protein, partial [Bacteroidota bacterium]|nr:Peptidase family protein [Bacteroidota bacterium]